MRVAVVQTYPAFGEVRANVTGALGMMEEVNADLYVLPELFNTGYNFIDEKEVGALAESAEGPTEKAVAGFAKKKACFVIYGFAERADRLYNASAFVGPDGLIGIYRKVHLFNRENLFFAPGNLGFPVYETPHGIIGMMICFDWIYPESARTLMLRGAQLIAHPSNLVLPFCPDAMVTRCLENRIFAVTADRVGTEARGDVSLTFIGKSEIVSPRGEILLRLGTETGIVVAEIDLIISTFKKVNEFNDVVGGRRTDQYKL